MHTIAPILVGCRETHKTFNMYFKFARNSFDPLCSAVHGFPRKPGQFRKVKTHLFSYLGIIKGVAYLWDSWASTWERLPA